MGKVASLRASRRVCTFCACAKGRKGTEPGGFPPPHFGDDSSLIKLMLPPHPTSYSTYPPTSSSLSSIETRKWAPHYMTREAFGHFRFTSVFTMHEKGDFGQDSGFIFKSGQIVEPGHVHTSKDGRVGRICTTLFGKTHSIPSSYVRTEIASKRLCVSDFGAQHEIEREGEGVRGCSRVGNLISYWLGTRYEWHVRVHTCGSRK